MKNEGRAIMAEQVTSELKMATRFDILDEQQVLSDELECE
jgi:hypothetical protein